MLTVVGRVCVEAMGAFIFPLLLVLGPCEIRRVQSLY